MNYRFGRRMPADVPATIVNKGGERISARICNFSISGLYLDVSKQGQRPFAAIEIELHSLQDQKPHHIEGRVVRVEDSGVAVMLDDSIPESLEAYNLLREYTRTSSSMVEGGQEALRLVDTPQDSEQSRDASGDTESGDSVSSIAEFSRHQRAKRL
jgi:hypothetical protein